MSTGLNPKFFISRDNNVVVEELLEKLKSQGCFDAKRKQYLNEILNKSSYQNSTSKVETLSTKFLENVRWPPGVEKHQLREQLRLHIQSNDDFNNAVRRLAEQEVISKFTSEIKPLIESKACEYLDVDYEKHKLAMLTVKQEEIYKPVDIEKTTQITSVSSTTITTTSSNTHVPVIVTPNIPPPMNIIHINLPQIFTPTVPPPIAIFPIPPPIEQFPPPPPPEEVKSLPPPPPPENGPNTPTDDYVSDFQELPSSFKLHSVKTKDIPQKTLGSVNKRKSLPLKWCGITFNFESPSEDESNDSETIRKLPFNQNDYQTQTAERNTLDSNNIKDFKSNIQNDNTSPYSSHADDYDDYTEITDSLNPVDNNSSVQYHNSLNNDYEVSNQLIKSTSNLSEEPIQESLNNRDAVEKLLEQPCEEANKSISTPENANNNSIISNKDDRIAARKEQIRARLLEIDARRSQIQKEEILKKFEEKDLEEEKNIQQQQRRRRDHHNYHQSRRTPLPRDIADNDSAGVGCKRQRLSSNNKLGRHRTTKHHTAGDLMLSSSSRSSTSGSSSSSYTSNSSDDYSSSDSESTRPTNRFKLQPREQSNYKEILPYPKEIGSQSPPSPNSSDGDDELFPNKTLDSPSSKISPTVKIKAESEPEEGELSSEDGEISNKTKTNVSDGIQQKSQTNTSNLDNIPLKQSEFEINTETNSDQSNSKSEFIDTSLKPDQLFDINMSTNENKQ